MNVTNCDPAFEDKLILYFKLKKCSFTHLRHSILEYFLPDGLEIGNFVRRRSKARFMSLIRFRSRSHALFRYSIKSCYDSYIIEDSSNLTWIRHLRRTFWDTSTLPHYLIRVFLQRNVIWSSIRMVRNFIFIWYILVGMIMLQLSYLGFVKSERGYFRHTDL